MEPCLTQSEFAVPIEERWLEDFVPGTVYEFGHMELNEAEIIDFARRFDPQPMHVDAQAAISARLRG